MKKWKQCTSAALAAALALTALPLGNVADVNAAVTSHVVAAEAGTTETVSDIKEALTEISLSTSMVTGSAQWSGGTGNGVENVVDGNTNSFFDGVEDGWLQIDLGEAQTITAIAYAPRSGYADRVVGASFYGSNDGATWTPLYTIGTSGSAGEYTYIYSNDFLTSDTTYRYIKYSVPTGDYYCNIAEIKLFSEWDLNKIVSYYEALVASHDTYAGENPLAGFDAAIAEAKKLIAAGNADAATINTAVYEIMNAYEVLKPIYNYDYISGINGEIRYDNNGEMIQAHGGQIQKLTYDMNSDGDTDDAEDTFWYWVGEDKTNDYRPCPGIKAYISYDLYNWTDMGNVLKTVESWEQFTTDEYFTSLYGSEGVVEGDENYDELFAVYGDIWAPDSSNSGCVIERPKMLYNDKNENYVIWFHADGQVPGSTGSNYAKAKAGVAISDSPFGPFKFLGSYLLNYDEKADHGFDNEVGGHVRDMNLFKDDNGEAYVLYSSDGNQTMHIARLNEDYTNVANPTINDDEQNDDFSRNFIGMSREAPAMFKYKDKYFVITSGCTGWAPNQASYAVADHPLGPWTTMGDPCVGDTARTTFSSQSTCVVPIDPENGVYMFMGDRWSNPDQGYQLRYSTYIWLPIEFTSDTTIEIHGYRDWKLTNRDALNTVMAKADAEDASLYTEESWKAFRAIYNEVAALLDDYTVDQAEVDAAAAKLEGAFALLRTVKGYLEDEIKAGSLAVSEKVKYTDSSWKVYELVLEKINAYLTRTDLEWYEAKDAVDALAKAKELLQEKTITGIQPGGSAPVVEEPDQVTVKAAKAVKGKKLKVTFKAVDDADGYEVQYCLKKNFKSGVKSVNTKKTSATITKLKKGKKYSVRVRAYKVIEENGVSVNVYGEWSKVKTSGKIK